MDKYKETFETWNKVAGLYEEKFMDLAIYNESYDFLCAHLRAARPRLLEVGCGPGNITQYLLHKRPDLDIFGIDVAPNMVGLAQKNNPSARFEVMDARRIGDLTGRYDAVVSGFILPYFSPEEAAQSIADTAALLRDNGLFYLSFVGGAPEQSGFKTNSVGDRVYFYYHPVTHIQETLKNSGFELLQAFDVPYHDSETHTIFVARKP